MGMGVGTQLEGQNRTPSLMDWELKSFSIKHHRHSVPISEEITNKCCLQLLQFGSHHAILFDAFGIWVNQG